MLTPQGRVDGPPPGGQAEAVQASAGAGPGPGAAGAVLTPQQVAGRLGGRIIASYPDSSPARPAAYGPRDAVTALMARGHRVALREGIYYVDGEPVTPGMLAGRAAGPGPDAPGAGR